jgi:hypothetical protein
MASAATCNAMQAGTTAETSKLRVINVLSKQMSRSLVHWVLMQTWRGSRLEANVLHATLYGGGTGQGR